MNIPFSDVGAERAILASIYKYNQEAYYEVSDIITEKSFTEPLNAAIYKCFKHVLEQSGDIRLDLPTIISASQELKLHSFFEKVQDHKHLKAITETPVNITTTRRFANKIRKLEIAKTLYAQIDVAKSNLEQVTGNESVNEIIGSAEDTILNFSTLLNENDGPQKLFTDIEVYLKHLAENPCEQMGISTGFAIYDKAIGGGLRPGVSVISARVKTGKSLLCINIGTHISKNLNIPVLYLDTEMSREDHIHRILAMLSEIKINDIETGKFASKDIQYTKLNTLGKAIKEIPFYYKCIAGMPLEEQLALIRRWIVKDVGLEQDGTAKKCVVLYDYLKLMSADGISNDMKEYQLLGFMMNSLVNLSLKYKVPFLSTLQTNRDGINKESTDVASGSDRIVWLCNNFSIYKFKSDEEIAEDGVENGNRKLVPIISRHGACLDDGDYINMQMKGDIAKIVEGKTRFELLRNKKSANSGFEVDDNNDEENIPFD